MPQNFKYFFYAALLLAASDYAKAWEPGVYPAADEEVPSKGFTVDTGNRNDVLAFWHAVYQASEGYQDRIDWSGNYSGKNGTVSKTFIRDVERRVNYFRAMSGVSASVSVNTGSKVGINAYDPYKPAGSTLKSEAAQDAALMMVRNYNSSTGLDPALTHNPTPGLIGWSPAAWNGSSHGNFAFGLYGPGAVSEYMAEELSRSAATSVWNTLVGHRRWVLFPRATDFATGDQPGKDATVPPTNVLYVLQKDGEFGIDATPTFVAYPSPGFFPAAVNSPYWSLSRRGADFTFATVKMSDAAGKPVVVENIRRDNSYGDPAIVWEVKGSVAVTEVQKDTAYHVSVSGISGPGVPTSYSYTVTLINPDHLTSNQAITGPATAASGASTTYTFRPPAGAESIRCVAALRSSEEWVENAEDSSEAKLLSVAGDDDSLVVNPANFLGFEGISGSKSFHLTFATSYDLLARGVPEQGFEIDRDILPNSNATLKFRFRRGYMTTTSRLVVEMTADGGASWQQLGAAISGLSNNLPDNSISSASRPLPKSSEPIRVRFRYLSGGGAIYTEEAAPDFPTGIFLDDVKTGNCDWLDEKKASTLDAAATKFVLSAKSAGVKLVSGQKWHLRLRTQLGGKWFAAGPSKVVTITP